MPKAWTDKTEYKHLSAELATSTEHDFERKVLPLVRLGWAAAVGTPRRLTFDRAGADLLVWSDVPPLPLVVQCKGFHVPVLEQSQADQCLASIEKFGASGLSADTYLLVHNRDARHVPFNEAVKAGLSRLEKQGKVRHALLWDRQTLLRKTFDAVVVRCRAALRDDAVARRRVHVGDLDPITQVPLRITRVRIDPNRLSESGEARTVTDDPAKWILNAVGTPITCALCSGKRVSERPRPRFGPSGRPHGKSCTSPPR